MGLYRNSWNVSLELNSMTRRISQKYSINDSFNVVLTPAQNGQRIWQQGEFHSNSLSGKLSTTLSVSSDSQSRKPQRKPFHFYISVCSTEKLLRQKRRWPSG